MTQDGWAADQTDYTQFSTPGNRPGFAVVRVHRLGWGGKDVPKGGSRVVIRVGELVRKDKQPALGRGHRSLHLQDQPARGPDVPAPDAASAVPRRRQDRSHVRSARHRPARPGHARARRAGRLQLLTGGERDAVAPRLRRRAARSGPLSCSQPQPEAPPRDAVDLDAREHASTEPPRVARGQDRAGPRQHLAYLGVRPARRDHERTARRPRPSSRSGRRGSRA